ncbi:MAG: type II toxin-antitoxin system RatA family toxin [Gammaproteobacteria bacterium]|nr:type II toxin-antitoxin system RatA family toxin [Gammaproteobacteria bacterium]
MPYPVQAVYEIVNDVTRYPEFLPWCKAVEVVAESAEEVIATLDLAARGIRQSLTTRNVLNPHESIELNLVSGPFSQFHGIWRFTRLGLDEGCKLELRLDFRFSGARSLLHRTFTGVFSQAGDKLVDAFCARARALLD